MQRNESPRLHRSAKGDGKQATVTLVGSRLARQGCEYVQGMPGEECQACRFISFCYNLPTGRRFKVTSIRKVEHDCLIHEDGKVHAVEVEPVGFDAGVDIQLAVTGSTITIEPLTCGYLECPNFPLCYQRDADQGSKFVVQKVSDDLACIVGWKRKRVQLNYAP